ncbi:hypothetical protein [Bacillus ndiopicus]|uniref:hypothetical protein n=1 Tax=Bacillus ndiopicus TaxID=1347368 RepID=UPI0005AACE79|nr:hypothetical protein [Bacillus ndiopicus]
MGNKDVTEGVSTNAYYEVVGSAYVSYNNELAGYMQSARINLLEGYSKVLASNTGSNTLVVRLMKMESSGVIPSQHIVKEWNVSVGKSLDTGIFSLEPNTYFLRLSRTSASYPTSGTGRLQSIRPL